MRVLAVQASLAVDVLKKNKTHLISQELKRFGEGAEHSLQAEDRVENLTVPC